MTGVGLSTFMVFVWGKRRRTVKKIEENKMQNKMFTKGAWEEFRADCSARECGLIKEKENNEFEEVN